MTDPKLSILLVEDNEGDILLTQHAFAESRLRVDLRIARRGESALATLRDAADGTLPDLILLDLNLPGASGVDVLRALKADPRHRSIPVLILTSSRRRADIAEAYSEHANSYLTKPLGMKALQTLVRGIEDYWGRHVSLPGRDGSLN